VAAGTLIGGPLGDRFGGNTSFGFNFGSAPFYFCFTLICFGLVLSVVIGIVIASAFSAILVFAQELMPGKVGMISGLFFGFAFGMGGLGSAILGYLADQTSIEYVYKISSFLPCIAFYLI
jgi:FSR family fosmidomycin resistance protein-like MFS transporter